MLKLEKLTIYVEKNQGLPFEYLTEVLFNPNQVTISKTGWKSTKHGLEAADEPATLSLELMFDTSLPQPAASSKVRSAAMAVVGRSSLLPSLGRSKDVRKHTNPIVWLTEPRGNLGNVPRPPRCELRWGNPKKPFFRGVMKSVTQTFSRFLEDGTPVRATLSCEFEEWEPPEYTKKKKNQIDDPIRIVRRGETLSSIAAEEYGDPSQWRIIAAANRMDDPRQLMAGQWLTVPPLRLGDELLGR